MDNTEEGRKRARQARKWLREATPRYRERRFMTGMVKLVFGVLSFVVFAVCVGKIVGSRASQPAKIDAERLVHWRPNTSWIEVTDLYVNRKQVVYLGRKGSATGAVFLASPEGAERNPQIQILVLSTDRKFLRAFNAIHSGRLEGDKLWDAEKRLNRAVSGLFSDKNIVGRHHRAADIRDDRPGLWQLLEEHLEIYPDAVFIEIPPKPRLIVYILMVLSLVVLLWLFVLPIFRSERESRMMMEELRRRNTGRGEGKIASDREDGADKPSIPSQPS